LLNTLKPEEDLIKRKDEGEVKGTYCGSGQSVSPFPCDKSSVKVKTMECLEAMASDRGHGIFAFAKCMILGLQS
jgi:hypothetical protein